MIVNFMTYLQILHIALNTFFCEMRLIRSVEHEESITGCYENSLYQYTGGVFVDVSLY